MGYYSISPLWPPEYLDGEAAQRERDAEEAQDNSYDDLKGRRDPLSSDINLLASFHKSVVSAIATFYELSRELKGQFSYFKSWDPERVRDIFTHLSSIFDNTLSSDNFLTYLDIIARHLARVLEKLQWRAPIPRDHMPELRKNLNLTKSLINKLKSLFRSREKEISLTSTAYVSGTETAFFETPELFALDVEYKKLHVECFHMFIQQLHVSPIFISSITPLEKSDESELYKLFEPTAVYNLGQDFSRVNNVLVSFSEFLEKVNCKYSGEWFCDTRADLYRSLFEIKKGWQDWWNPPHPASVQLEDGVPNSSEDVPGSDRTHDPANPLPETNLDENTSTNDNEDDSPEDGHMNSGNPVDVPGLPSEEERLSPEKEGIASVGSDSSKLQISEEERLIASHPEATAGESTEGLGFLAAVASVAMLSIAILHK